MSNNFFKDLKLGEYYEKKLLDYIPYETYEKIDGCFKYYDLIIYKKNGQKTTYEVKSDRLMKNTGNICIEYKYKNNLSGISTTTAKYWAIFEIKDNFDTLYKIPTKIIREFIRDKRYTRDCKGGDFKASDLYLFDKTLFENFIIFQKKKNKNKKL